jgi:hypothetical protein
MRLLLTAAALGAIACNNSSVSPVVERQPVSMAPSGPVQLAPADPTPSGPATISPSGPVNAAPQPPLTASAEVAMIPAGTTRLAQVSAVHLVLAVDGLSGVARITLELTSPSGRHFQRLSTTVLDDGQRPRLVAFDVPVAGTAIESGMMSGQWTARFSIGAKPLAVQTFALDP